jgi:hypothetical protein
MRQARIPIAASQTFKEGDWIAVNSSGQGILAVASGNGSSTNGQVPAWSGGATTITNLIVGRAIEDAQPQSGDPTILPNPKLYVEVIVAEPGTQFLMPLYHATPGSAYPNPNLIGTQCGLWNLNGSTATFATGTNVPTNLWVARIDSTTVAQLNIVDFDPTDYPSWPDIGQTAAPSSGTQSQYCGTWVEFLGGTTLLSGARPLTRSN